MGGRLHSHLFLQVEVAKAGEQLTAPMAIVQHGFAQVRLATPQPGAVRDGGAARIGTRERRQEPIGTARAGIDDRQGYRRVAQSIGTGLLAGGALFQHEPTEFHT